MASSWSGETPAAGTPPPGPPNTWLSLPPRTDPAPYRSYRSTRVGILCCCLALVYLLQPFVTVHVDVMWTDAAKQLAGLGAAQPAQPRSAIPAEGVAPAPAETLKSAAAPPRPPPDAASAYEDAERRVAAAVHDLDTHSVGPLPPAGRGANGVMAVSPGAGVSSTSAGDAIDAGTPHGLDASSSDGSLPRVTLAWPDGGPAGLVLVGDRVSFRASVASAGPATATCLCAWFAGPVHGCVPYVPRRNGSGTSVFVALVCDASDRGCGWGH